MAGYSGTPLVKKLGIKDGHRVAVVNPSPDFERLLESLPWGAVLYRRLRVPTYDVIVFFASAKSQLRKKFASLAKRLEPAGGLWVAWPKRSSGVAADLSESDVRAIGLEAGLVDNKVCAIDDTWSGLRFVYRLADRPK